MPGSRMARAAEIARQYQTSLSRGPVFSAAADSKWIGQHVALTLCSVHLSM